jgi:NAD(P)-dependent dehydrogenase (short-subunit alcohol dehydrogenase family)|tara:strand:+ start:7293 stop:8039 length:747 start_codon:yes stop_codon:yes gene_type:complete
MKLENKIILITGGSRGIGFTTAKLFVDEGATVIITSKNQEQIDKAKEELRDIVGIKADITKENDVKNLIATIIEKFGRIDILVNNAGVLPRFKMLHEISEEEWDDIIDVNLTGQFRITKNVIPHMQKNGQGAIINMSSDAGLKAFENFHADAYSAAKASMIHLTKCWALEYAKDKIRVNCICSAVVDTDMTKSLWLSPTNIESTIKEHPLGRIGKPIDIAKASLYFASDDSSWTTGAILVVDGGVSIK